LMSGDRGRPEVSAIPSNRSDQPLTDVVGCLGIAVDDALAITTTRAPFVRTAEPLLQSNPVGRMDSLANVRRADRYLK
jgi:hypothetical protein